MEQDQFKKSLLHHLITTATGGANKGLQEVIASIKNALSAYKNFAKEWDGLKGATSGGANKPADMMKSMMPRREESAMQMPPARNLPISMPQRPPAMPPPPTSSGPLPTSLPPMGLPPRPPMPGGPMQ